MILLSFIQCIYIKVINISSIFKPVTYIILKWIKRFYKIKNIYKNTKLKTSKTIYVIFNSKTRAD